MPRILIAVVVLLLTACGGASPQSLAALDIEPLLVQDGDLPAGVAGAQVRDTAPGMFSSVPKADKTISVQLANSVKQIGNVTVLLYAQDADRDSAFATVMDGMGEPVDLAGIGDRAVGESVPLLSTVTDVLFIRCHALAHTRMLGVDMAAATAYMKRLDKRLQSAVC